MTNAKSHFWPGTLHVILISAILSGSGAGAIAAEMNRCEVLLTLPEQRWLLDLSAQARKAKTPEQTLRVLEKMYDLKVSVHRLADILSASPLIGDLRLTDATLRRLIDELQKMPKLDRSTLQALIRDIAPTFYVSLRGKNAELDSELPIAKIRDQQEGNDCWVNAFVSSAESILARRLGRPHALSAEYLYLMSFKLRSIIAVLDKDVSMNDIVDGGFETLATALIVRYGIVPESAWPYEKSPSTHLVNTGKILEEFIEYHRNKPSYLKLKPKEIAENVEVAFDVLVKKNGWGHPKPTFKFEGKTYTPQSFAKKFLPELLDGMKTMILPPARTAYGPPNAIRSVFRDQKQDALPFDFSFNWKGTSTNSQNAVDKVRRLIDAGQAPYLVYHEASSIDQVRGAMPLHVSKDSHAVTIVGYLLDSKGKVRLFKIQNSWGINSGDHGFYYMPVEFFRENAFWISYFGSST